MKNIYSTHLMRAYRFGVLGVIVSLLMLFGMVSLASAESPEGCTADNFVVDLIKSESVAEVGDSVTFTVEAGNPASGNGCDIENMTIELTLPDGSLHVFGPDNYPNPTPLSEVGSQVYLADAADLVDGVWTASVSWAGTLKDIVDQPSTGSKQISVFEIKPLEVSKTATPSFDRSFEWSIDKSVDSNEHNLLDGESGSSEYVIAVDKTTADNNYAVAGTITIFNPNDPLDATIESVSDIISDYGAADSIVCDETLPFVLGPGETLECDYLAALPDDSSRTNTATVETSGVIAGGEGVADIDFAGIEPSIIGFDEVTVTDTFAEFEDQNGGGPVTTNDDAIYNYTVQFLCSEDEGEHPNTASLVEPQLSDDELVTVNCFAGLTIEKTAETSYDRAYEWSIDKTGSESSLSLANGESTTVDYSVMVDAAPVDSDMTVSGNIIITNPAGNPEVEVTDVADELDVAGAVTVECTDEDADTTAPWTLSAEEVLSCTYSTTVSDMSDTLNTVTVETAGLVPGGEAVADVIWGDPADVIDECIDVSDTNVAGLLGTVCAGDQTLPHTYEYTLTFGTEGDEDVVLQCGNNEHRNVADFITNDTGTTGDDDWVVAGDVECAEFAGCTPGYWKNNWWSEDEGVSPQFSDFFDDVFGTDVTIQWADKGKPGDVEDPTLLQSLAANGGGMNALVRHATAALLNASFLGGASDYVYPLSVGEVIAMFNEAEASGNVNETKDIFAEYNELGCSLNAHGDAS